MNQRILISGASIAGLTVAHWLARHGFHPTIVERAGQPRPGGNGVDVRGQASEVLDRMGLLHRVRAAAADVHGMKFVDADDRTIGRIDTRDPASVEIMRGDLVALLGEATPAVEYLFDDSIRDLAQDDDGVTVRLDRAGTRRYDLVIGADGLHSNVRRLAFGPEANYIRHRDHYFAFADADAALAENRWVTMHNTPGRMAGVYRSGNHPQAKAYFIYRSAPITYDHRDVGQHKRLVSAAFADRASWRIGQLLDTALADPDFYFDALSQVRMDSWSTGRVALVGDAAWCASPASGAGAELALVGAYRLAGELAAANGDHRIAFARYHHSHRALVDRKHRIDTNVRLMAPRTAAGMRVRNALTRLPVLSAMGALARLVPARIPGRLPQYLPAG